jgi:hypothetical protein
MSFSARPMDRDKAEAELALHIKKATSAEETAPKQKHVRGKPLSNMESMRISLNVQEASPGLNWMNTSTNSHVF